MLSFYIILFIVSFVLLLMSGKWLVSALIRISRYLRWREFIVAFIIVAFASSIPNFFLGVTSAFNKIPQLSFGDVIGGNLVDLTIVVALAALFSKGLRTDSRMVQTSALLTMVIAVLPLFMILDGSLGRLDGIILILIFFFYTYWLFTKNNRLGPESESEDVPAVTGFSNFLKDLVILAMGLIFLLVASQGIVTSASYFSSAFNLPLVLVGALVIGLANSVPEAYFIVVAAKKGNNWMCLGDLMGSVIVCATLVLGIVAVIFPIVITDFSPYAIARIFLLAASMFFFFFIKTGKMISRKEAMFLIGLYIAFVLIEIFSKITQ